MIITDVKTLRQKSELCTIEEGLEITEKLKKELLTRPLSAVGLSAIQIGIPKRVFVIHVGIVPSFEESPFGEFMTVINPSILVTGTKMRHVTEGCLSFPETEVVTERYWEIQVNGIQTEDPQGTASTENLVGFLSVVFQHETDHLDGVLFFDRGKIWRTPLGRNDLCLCGSGKKFKKCHGVN